MYNRILKRPMFKMGGRSYSAQGTGITSGLDTPKRGLVDGPGGYAGDTREIINTEREEIFKTEYCRSPISEFDIYQLEEANIHIEKVIGLQNNIN